MDIGSEIGQKMRSAVKAKLCELGAGYIDEELPDYVMILLVNKKSRQQMADALNLFLGENTQDFVNWLHEVLEKLQKVTVPKKSKSSVEAEKKEKKRKEKERKQKEADSSETKTEELPSLPPITEVIKEGFLKRAQQELEIEASVKTKKNDTDEFDIPSEQSLNLPAGDTQPPSAPETQQQYDWKQLQEIQEKIYAAKQQLRTMASDEASSDSNADLSDFEEDINNDVEPEKDKEESLPPATPPPMDTDQNTKRPSIHINPNFLPTRREKITAPGEEPERPEPDITDNVDDDIASDEDEHNLDNEGSKRVIKLSAVRRAEREIYVPKFRRIEMIKRVTRSKAEDEREAPRHRERQNPVHSRLQLDRHDIRLNRLDARRRIEPRNRTRSPPHKQRSRSPVPMRRRTRSPPAPRPTARRRSRTPPLPHKSPVSHKSPLAHKPITPSPKSSQKSQQTEEEMRRDLLKKRVGSKVTVAPPRPPSEEVDVAVNSQITVKPRPKVPANKQANKLLLLKAVADAQLSTFTAKKRPRSPVPLANRSKRGLHGNIVIEVPHLEEEYVPASSLAAATSKDNTQFVVTLTGVERIQKRSKSQLRSEEATETDEVPKSQPVVEEKPKRPVKERIGFRMNMEEDEETKRRRKERFDRLYERKPSPNVKKSRSRSHSPAGYRNRRESSYDNNRRDRGRDRDYDRNRYDNNNDRRDNFSRDNDNRKNALRYRTPPYRNNAATRYDNNHSHTDDNYRREQGRDDSNRYEKETNRYEQDRNEQTIDRPNRQANKFYNSANVVNPKIQELVDSESRHSGTSHSNTPPIRRRHRARTISPINFDLTDEEARDSDDDDFESRVNKENEGDKKPVKVKKIESTHKFDNLPTLLSAVTVTDSTGKVKLKERCKFFPHCTNDKCEYHHPTTPCNSFPICKFGDKCLYLHPPCKFDEHCVRPDCPYMHTIPIVVSVKGPAAPLASSVVPVQNYKSLSVTPLLICKYYPSCTNAACHYFHPKPCKYGKNCLNKLECNFYHHELPTQDKFKWISPAV